MRFSRFDLGFHSVMQHIVLFLQIKSISNIRLEEGNTPAPAIFLPRLVLPGGNFMDLVFGESLGRP